MERDDELLLGMFIMGIIIVILSVTVIYETIQISEFKEHQGVDASWFRGTWLNTPDYDAATIQLHFYNVFDDAIIYTKDVGEKSWSNPKLSSFTVYHSQDLRHGNFKDYIIYLELPLNSSIYICSIWDTFGNNDIFDIYYGNNAYMRFYRVG